VRRESNAQRRRGVRAAVVALFGVALLVLASPASAEVEGVELGLVPVGQPGPFFDISMRPGETRTLEVEIANHGSNRITARTYAAG